MVVFIEPAGPSDKKESTKRKRRGTHKLEVEKTKTSPTFGKIRVAENNWPQLHLRGIKEVLFHCFVVVLYFVGILQLINCLNGVIHGFRMAVDIIFRLISRNLC